MERSAEGHHVYFQVARQSPLFEPAQAIVRRTLGAPEVVARHLAASVDAGPRLTVIGRPMADQASTLAGLLADGRLRPQAPDRVALGEMLEQADGDPATATAIVDHR